METKESPKKFCNIKTKQKSVRHGVYLEVGRGYDLVSFMNFISKVKNITITSKTLDNYIKKGYMSKGNDIDLSTNQLNHRMYHPLSIVEYLTAFCLLHGSWLTDDKKDPNEKKFGIARATSQDIFIGRLAFLKNGYALKLAKACEQYKIYPFAIHTFYTFEHFYYSESGGIWANPINFYDDLVPCYEQAIKMLQKQFGTEENVKKYIAYNEMIYRSTFLYWYDRYIEDIIKNIPKELPEFPK